MSIIDLSGKRYGRLLVERQAGRDKHGNVMWLCKCDCGTEKEISGVHLRQGRTKSCGCLNSELARSRKYKHGMSKDPIYCVWNNLHRRSYGNGEIKVAECWLHDFQAFYDYVSKLPHFGEKGYSLDRIDTYENYEPNNVRWANNETQANNKRNNHLITYNGKTQTIAQWAKEKGLKSRTLERRINRLHWNIERALNTPPDEYRNRGKRSA